MKCEICEKKILRDSQCINYKYYHNDCIENLLQENQKLNGAIQTYDILLKSNAEENKQLKETLECTIGIVEHNRIISEKNKEIHQLKDNWIKLKEFVLKKQAILFNTEYACYSDFLDKMQELEKGSDSNAKD